MHCRRPQVRLVRGVIKDPHWGGAALGWDPRRHLWEGLAPPPQVLGGEREATAGKDWSKVTEEPQRSPHEATQGDQACVQVAPNIY